MQRAAQACAPLHALVAWGCDDVQVHRETLSRLTDELKADVAAAVRARVRAWGHPLRPQLLVASAVLMGVRRESCIRCAMAGGHAEPVSGAEHRTRRGAHCSSKLVASASAASLGQGEGVGLNGVAPVQTRQGGCFRVRHVRGALLVPLMNPKRLSQRESWV